MVSLLVVAPTPLLLCLITHTVGHDAQGRPSTAPSGHTDSIWSYPKQRERVAHLSQQPVCTCGAAAADTTLTFLFPSHAAECEIHSVLPEGARC